MADINVEMLKESLYKAARALSCIGEVCVDVSKQHIGAEDAIDKIRGYLHSTDAIATRYRVDKLIEECMKPVVTNTFEENQNDWLNKALNERSTNLDRFVYFTTDTDKLREHKADGNRIAEAVERTKKYLKK